MDTENIEEKLRVMVARQFKVNAGQVTPGTMLFKEFQIDSLGIVELVMRIQEEFGVEIDDEELETLSTFRSLVDYVQARLPAGT